MQGGCRVCGVAASGTEPCAGCGALPLSLWPGDATAPGVRVEGDHAHVAVELLSEPSTWAPLLLLGGAGIGALALLMLVVQGPVAFFMVILAAAPFAGLFAILELERTRGQARVEIRAGGLFATSGYVFRQRVSLPLAEIRALFAARWWNRARGFGTTLVVLTTRGERLALFPPRADAARVVSAERLLAPRLAASR